MRCPKCFGTEQMIITENGVRCDYADCQHEINVHELTARAEKAEGELARVRGITAEQIKKEVMMYWHDGHLAINQLASAILTLITGKAEVRRDE